MEEIAILASRLRSAAKALNDAATAMEENTIVPWGVVSRKLAEGGMHLTDAQVLANLLAEKNR